MREKEREIAARTAYENSESHSDELRALKEQHKLNLKSHDQRIETLEESRAKAEAENNQLRETIVQNKIEYEESFAKLEVSIQESQEAKVASRLEHLEARLASLQISRDELQSRSQQQAEEYKRLFTQNESERKEFEKWLAKEREGREKAERECLSAKVSFVKYWGFSFSPGRRLL